MSDTTGIVYNLNAKFKPLKFIVRSYAQDKISIAVYDNASWYGDRTVTFAHVSDGMGRIVAATRRGLIEHGYLPAAQKS